MCGLFGILNLAYKVAKKHVFSFFTPCHCYNVISVSCLAVILFSPTHLAVHKIWIGCMLLQVHIAMLRTYSCEWWFHPALRKIFFFWYKHEKVIRSFWYQHQSWICLLLVRYRACGRRASYATWVPNSTIQLTRTSVELARDEVAARLQHRNSKGGKVNWGISR